MLWLGSELSLRHVTTMGARGQAAIGKGRDEALRVDVQDIACRRGGRMLFAGLSFTLGAGEAAHISGPNGVGKSSLLRLLCGLLLPFAGRVSATGAMSLADDRLALDADQPLARAIAFWARLDGQAETASTTALRAMGLDMLADVPVRILSTGQRKRATLARTIASGAPIWLLDEPANGLDDRSVALLGEAVQAHRRGGGIVIAASHQPLPWQADVALALTAPAEDASS